MPKLTWAILCLDSAIDRERNNISLFQVIDQLNVPENEIIPNKQAVLSIKLQLIFLLRRDKGNLPKEKYQIIIEEIGPKSDNIFRKEMPAEFPENGHRLRLIANFVGLPITGIGKHLFRLSLMTPHGLVLLGEVPFDVEIKQE